MATDIDYMRLALRLARRGYGATAPNPMVGAVLVRRGTIIGRGWHHRAGAPHAEIEALKDASRRGHPSRGATLYVTLEPCCTHGRTPPCTEAILAAGIRRVVVGATDPNPYHDGRGIQILRRARLAVKAGVLADDCARLNEAFNHWIVERTPWVTVKAAMTLDGKIATRSGESKWITGEPARALGMNLRLGADAVLVGINTILADNPGLTYRGRAAKKVRRIILDAGARTPLRAKVVSDAEAAQTTIVVSRRAPPRRVRALAARVRVLVAPSHPARGRTATAGHRGSGELIDLRRLLRRLGAEGVTGLLVEGGGEVNASFLLAGLAHRVAFFYAPKILGGREACHAVEGAGARTLKQMIGLEKTEWRRIGRDWLLTGLCAVNHR